jgi:hypothetical protein
LLPPSAGSASRALIRMNIDAGVFSVHFKEMATVAEPEKPRISVVQAAAAAQTYFQKLFGVARSSLEEVELSEDGKYWMITLGHEVPRPPAGAFALPPEIFPPQTKFKIFKVDAQTGEVLSMKMRLAE